MPLIRWRLVPFALENVSKMASTTISAYSRLQAASSYQLAQVISMRVMNIDLSSCRLTAPGIVSKKAGHPHPDALLVSATHLISKAQLTTSGLKCIEAHRIRRRLTYKLCNNHNGGSLL
jgi:hypothetical protein